MSLNGLFCIIFLLIFLFLSHLFLPSWFLSLLYMCTVSLNLKSSNGLDHKLVHIDKPILKIPNICIHLAHADVHKAFSPNKETHMCALFFFLIILCHYVPTLTTLILFFLLCNL